MTSPPPRRGRPPGRTSAQLLEVARGLFLEKGYAGTTMNEVAARARISKASLYRDHPSKEALFAAVVRDWAAAGRDAMRPHLDRLESGTDARTDLVHLARVMCAGILSADVLAMRRLVTGMSPTFPEVATGYLEESWQRNVDALGASLAVLDRQGRLRVPDPRLAADQLTWLVIGAPLNERLLTEGGSPAPAPEAAVDLFLAGYGPSGS